jgi:hypothetical protein
MVPPQFNSAQEGEESFLNKRGLKSSDLMMMNQYTQLQCPNRASYFDPGNSFKLLQTLNLRSTELHRFSAGFCPAPTLNMPPEETPCGLCAADEFLPRAT